MADGSITFSTALDNKELEKELQSVTKKINSLEEKIAQKQSAKMPLVSQAKELGAELDAAKAKLYEMQNAARGTYSADEIKEQRLHVNGLQSEWNSVQGRVERYDTAIANATTELDRNKKKAGAITKELAEMSDNASMMPPALDRAEKALAKFTNRVKQLARRALVFYFISSALRSLRDWMGKVIKSNSEASAAIARLKGALLTLVQPLVNVIIPAFTTLVDVVTRVTTAIARFASMISGTTIESSRTAAKALNSQTTAISETGKAAKKAEKALASFDEINQLSTGGDSGASGASSGASGGISPDFSDGLDVGEYKDKIDELTVYLSGALLALGAILAFSGANIPLGIGLMAIGAITMADEIKENWGAMDGPVGRAITSVLVVLGSAALVIGALLLFSGANIPLGFGLMAVGAASLATAVAANWGTMDPEIQRAITGILSILGTAALAIGAVLAFSGVNVPLGIGLMLAGAAALGTAAALNWDKIKEKLKDKSFAGVMSAIGAALLVFGALFAFTGTNIPLGVGLMLAGAASLGTAVALNWDAIKEKLQDKSFAGVLVAIGASLLVLGALLAFSGINIPLGVGLMLAGAASLGTAVALNWDAILDKLKEAFGNIKSWWNASVEPKLTLSFWKDKFKNIKEALVSKIKDAVNGGIDLFNRFIDWVNSKLNITWDAVEIAGHEIIPAGSFQLFSIPRIPKLAQGAVIPPNREFMAVLGDQRHGANLEAPEELIRKIVREESGSGGGTTVALLQSILDAVRGGKVMAVDKKVLARVTAQGINDMTRAAGKSVLLI